MNVGSLLPGDLIEVDKKGRKFVASVEAVAQSGVVTFHPVGRESYRSCSAREVVRHWRLMGRVRAERKQGPA